MSSIIMRATVVLAGALILISAGCSKERSGALINPDTGKHTAQWATSAIHGAAAKGDASSTTGFSGCQECHGTDFSGGMSKLTCLNTTGCHGAGVMAPHSPKPWRGGLMTHTNSDPSNAPVCAQCHTNGANSTVQPSPFASGTAPGCFNNTLCHAAVGHPPLWENPYYHGAAAKGAPGATTGFSFCQTCHGNDFTGGNSLRSCLNTAGCHGAGVNAPHAAAWILGDTFDHGTADPGNAPACALCHLGSRTPPSYATVPAGTQPDCFNNTLCHAAPTCGTCHAIPPNGTVPPNVAGQHAPHAAVSPIVNCATCHTGAGFGTPLHNNTVVNVILNPTYNAKSGTAAYNATTNTCSNVSCHGGQTTPGWLSGTLITVNTQCTSCHTPGTTQYNSQNSGRHSTHASQGVACYTCHDTTLLAVNHFTTLNTTAMEGPASATLRPQLQYNGTSCNPSAGGLTGCHSSNTW